MELGSSAVGHIPAEKVVQVKCVADLLTLPDDSFVDEASYRALRRRIVVATFFKAGNYLPSLEFRQALEGICDFGQTDDDLLEGMNFDAVEQIVLDAMGSQVICPCCGVTKIPVDLEQVRRSAYVDIKHRRSSYFSRLYFERLDAIPVRLAETVRA